MQANTPHTILPSSRHNYLLYYFYILGLYIIIGKSYINILLALVPRHGPKSDGNSTPYSDSKHILFIIKSYLFRSYTFSLNCGWLYDSPLLLSIPKSGIWMLRKSNLPNNQLSEAD